MERRREIARFYDKALSPVDFTKIPESNSSVDHAYHLYPLQIDFVKTDVIKSELFKKMKELMKGIEIVYHCAATAHEGLSVFSPFEIRCLSMQFSDALRVPS